MGGCSGNSTVNNHHNGIRKKSRGNNLGLQWWRKLTLPRRGKKDTLLEPIKQLNETQQGRLIERTQTLKKSILAARVTRIKHLAEGQWHDNKNGGGCLIKKTKGNSLQSMGEFENGQHLLYPEEALYLVDKGSLQLLYHNVPLSVQKTWVKCLSCTNALSIHEYLTFAFLRRCGFVVRRYSGPPATSNELSINPTLSVWKVGSFKRKDQQSVMNKPAFHVVVFTFENFLPYLKNLAKWSILCQRSRVRIALVDRGVVGFVDIAANATPLSERFIKRLDDDRQACATKLKEGDATAIFDQGFFDSWNNDNAELNNKQ